MAAWGNFSKVQLNFDISSNIHEVHKEQLNHGCVEVTPLMTELHQNWENNGQSWFIYNEFNQSRLTFGYSPTEKIMCQLKKMNSILVFGYHDKLVDQDVLYAFFSMGDEMRGLQKSAINLIMPHLDAALRNIEKLKNKNNVVGLKPDFYSNISSREREVLKLVLMGKTNSEIGDELFISSNTVKNHMKSIFRKLKVRSRAEAVAKFLSEIRDEQGITC